MNIQQFVQDLQQFYNEMGTTFSDYQKSTGLTCASSCGKCCDNPNITATTLEMLPMAWDFYQRGIAEEWFEKLSTGEHPLCPVMKFTSEDRSRGQCIAYEFRPSLCRMFGVAGVLRKEGHKELSTCKIIRDTQLDLIKKAETNQESIPLMTEWTRRLSTLHPELIQNSVPISRALRDALEKVLLYAQYSQ